MVPTQGRKSLGQLLVSFLWTTLGCFLAAISLEVFLLPNQIIDGGIVGISMIFGSLIGNEWIPVFLVLLNLPFLLLAYKSIGRTFVFQMFLANIVFSGFLTWFHHSPPFTFEGDMLEIIVVGGLLLGIGIGIIIRAGGCLDGTEIASILLSKRFGFTVGQIILFINIFIFLAAGVVFNDWHPPIYSFMTFVVVIQIMDKVIVGLDETKSVMIVSQKSEAIANAIIHELGLGLTVMYGRGGFSREDMEILYVITERLQLGEVKEIIYREDPKAFVAVENLHEISNGTKSMTRPKKGGQKLLSGLAKK